MPAVAANWTATNRVDLRFAAGRAKMTLPATNMITPEHDQRYIRVAAKHLTPRDERWNA
jgi:hypothetical protein